MSKNNLKFTSANIDGEYFDELSKAAKIFHISENSIYKDLIELTKQNMHCGHLKGKLTEYQDHNPKRWETLYYSLNEDEIEIFGKLRQKYKISISKFAFIGFVLFWDLLMLIYKNRLKIIIPKDFWYSYGEFKEKIKILIPIFLKRLNIQKKE